METLAFTISVFCFFAAILIELLGSVIIKRRVYRFSSSLANLSTSMLSSGINIFFTLSFIGIYSYIYTTFSIVSTQPTWLTILVAVIIFDFIFYWNHRWSHEWSILWGAHITHHQSEDYNFTVALRQSATKNIINFTMSLPMAIIGIHPEAYLAASLIDVLYMFWIHTELIGKLPAPIEYIFNTPSHHRVHHASNPEYLDKNHGGIFIIWDRIFGTFQKETVKPIYGITTPLKSWNPIWANIHYYVELYQGLKNTSGFLPKIKLMFSSPAALGEKLNQTISFQPKTKSTYRKFDIQLNPRQQRYIFTQFVLCLSLFISYIYFFETFSYTYKLLFLSLLVISIVIVTSLMELKNWALKLEFARLLLLTGIIGYWLDIKVDISLLPMLASLGLFAIFTAWIYRAFLSEEYLRQYNLYVLNELK